MPIAHWINLFFMNSFKMHTEHNAKVILELQANNN